MSEKNEWKPIESAPKDGAEFLARWANQGGVVQIVKWDTVHGYFVSKGEPLLGFASNATQWAPLPVFETTSPARAQPDRDWELTCDHCDGSGHVFVERQVAERKSDVQEFKEECECCEGRGFTIAFEDIPGIAEYVRKSRPAPAKDVILVREKYEYALARLGLKDSAPLRVIFWDALDALEWDKATDWYITPLPSSAPGDAQDERQAFEAWMTSQGLGFLRDGDSYSLTYARRAWDAWQARGRLPAPAPAAGDALDLTLAQKYADACIAANANARDAERWRKAVSQWRINRVEVFDGITLSNAKGINWDDLTRQIDAALAAQVPQQGEA